MKKRITPFLAAAAAAIGGMFMGSPSSVTPSNHVNEGITQAPNTYNNNAQRQMAQNVNNAARHQVMQNYRAGGEGGDYGYGTYGMSPKDYGEYLLRSGRNKYNARKRKHIAKGIA
jgi:hypothetical protein